MKVNAPEKIYMPTELLSEEWTRHIEGEDIEYVRKDAFFDKAKSWFIQQHTGMWNEFQKYMKGEKVWK